MTVGASEEEARQWEISLKIERSGGVMFEGSVSVNQIKRSFSELASHEPFSSLPFWQRATHRNRHRAG